MRCRKYCTARWSTLDKTAGICLAQEQFRILSWNKVLEKHNTNPGIRCSKIASVVVFRVYITLLAFPGEIVFIDLPVLEPRCETNNPVRDSLWKLYPIGRHISLRRPPRWYRYDKFPLLKTLFVSHQGGGGTCKKMDRDACVRYQFLVPKSRHLDKLSVIFARLEKIAAIFGVYKTDT